MTKENRINVKILEKQARLKIAQSWQSRVNEMKSRKKDPINEQKFCEKHEISHTRFNRNKNLQSIPTWEKIKQVEAAFAMEGASPKAPVGKLLEQYREKLL